MRTPRFWQQNQAGVLPVLLQPAALVYDLALRTRFAFARPATAAMPVICVGNLTAGGAGKTPTAIAVAHLLLAMGHKPGFLSRGYGGSTTGSLLVDLQKHDGALTGDEPQLLAAVAPAIVSANRPAGARLAERCGIDVLIMDDGLQNPSLAKTLNIAVIDAGFGIGNGRVLPAGPLRGALEFQLGLVDALLAIGDGTAAQSVAQTARASGKLVLHGRLALQDADDLAGKPVIAFAGIGRPEKFFDSLRACGANLVAALPFPDHHAFHSGDAARLLATADAAKAQLVTTEKDFARLTAKDGDIARLRENARPVAAKLEFAAPEDIGNLLHSRLEQFTR